MPTTATRSPITSELIFDLPAVGAPALSPDGQTVAYVASRTSRETMSAESHIRLVAFDGSGDRQLTAGPRDGSPVWSPDGSQLAFLRAPPPTTPRAKSGCCPPTAARRAASPTSPTPSNPAPGRPTDAP